jgi:hypothetical protein
VPQNIESCLPNLTASHPQEITGFTFNLYRKSYRVLVGKPEGKRPPGRPRHRWEDNIKIDHQEVGCGGMNWIDLAQDRDRWLAVVNAVMNLWVS